MQTSFICNCCKKTRTDFFGCRTCHLSKNYIISHIFLTWNYIYAHYQSGIAIYQTETHYLQTRNFFYIKKIWKAFKEIIYSCSRDPLYYFSYINVSIFMFTFWFIWIIYLMSQLAMHKWPLDVSNIVFNFVLFWNPNFYFWTYKEVLNYTKIENKYYIIYIC